ncbi:MAG TPA: PIN domain-containing protein [Pyrinomonadaceae bacterium]|nr:PIN domain-containing protein [Pyrinomonadaceae bacterium]
MKTNYVLIDYENVQPDDIDTLQHEHVRVIVFVGPHQTKIAFETAAALQLMGANAEYVRLSGSGPNTLDFHIAYYLGQLIAKEPTAYFHIISKDTGFDPLVKHLKERKLRVCRIQTVGEIPILKPVDPKSSPDRVALIVADLQKRGAARPRTVVTLSSTISAMFQKQLTAQEVSSLISDLKKKGFVKVEGTKIIYNLPS